MTLSSAQPAFDPALPPTDQLTRGALRVMQMLGYSGLTEMTLANGRRTDVTAIGPSGEVVIIEIKSSVADYRADAKWPDYQAFCDQFYFAVGEGFPQELIPDECGLIVADGFGGAMIREAPEIKLAAARRKAMTLRFARLAAARWAALADPPLNGGLDAGTSLA